MWSAPAQRSGDGALDWFLVLKISRLQSKAMSPLRSATALQISRPFLRVRVWINSRFRSFTRARADQDETNRERKYDARASRVDGELNHFANERSTNLECGGRAKRRHRFRLSPTNLED